MSIVKENLARMFELARDPSEQARVELAGLLADIFLGPQINLGLREQEMANELIDQLLATSTPAIRACLVEKFVDVAKMPARVALRLAREPIDVARSILVSSPHLTDPDLIEVIERQGKDHALAVAERAAISEAVADALVTTGDIRVMQIVAENMGAHLTSQAVDAIADAARYAAALREPILRRPEMNAATAIKMFWWVEQDLRRYAIKRFGINAGQIDQALNATITTFLKDNAHDKDNDEVVAQVADWMEKHQVLNAQILPQVLRMGHFRLFHMMLARLLKLSLTLVDTITLQAGGRGLAAICRALDIDKPGFVSLFLLSRGGRPGEQVVHPRELSLALATFDRMSPAIAKDLLHTWNVNPDYLIKHGEEVAQEARVAVY